MTTQLPAHLQGRQRTKLTKIATQGLGGAMPPHISIRGNGFTLIDAAGSEAGKPVSTLQVCVFDISGPHNNKRYYPVDEQWTPDSNDPPTCWSANGIAPSREAAIPQSPLCADCRWNIRGSAVSKMSGAAIKACRDEKWLAVYVPQYPQMLFQLILTPGSFKNWKAFTKPFEGQDTDISDVVVQLGFEAGVNGVLTFQAMAYIDAVTADLRDKAIASKATDVLVGRNDQPRALPAPGQPGGTIQTPQTVIGSQQGQPASYNPAPFVPGAAPNAGFQPTGTAPQLPFGQPVPGASPSNGPLPGGQGAPPARRKRRTAAEMQAAAQAPQQVPIGQPGPESPGRQAPFPNSGQQPGFQPSAPPQQGPQFGIGGGMAPNAEVTAALQGIFGKQQ